MDRWPDAGRAARTSPTCAPLPSTSSTGCGRSKGTQSLEPCSEVHPDLFGSVAATRFCSDDPVTACHWRDSTTGPPDPSIDLVDLEAQAVQAVQGRPVDAPRPAERTTSSSPLRATKHDVVVDWPGACVRSTPCGSISSARCPRSSSIATPQCEELFRQQHVSHVAPPDAVNALVAAVAGYFTYMSLLPPPPGLPTVRAFQAVRGEQIARRWLAERCGWEPR